MGIFPSDAVMRNRFHELRKQSEEIRAASQPLRDQYNDLALRIQALESEQKLLVPKFREIEAPLFEIERERSLITKMLDRVTGEGE